MNPKRIKRPAAIRAPFVRRENLDIDLSRRPVAFRKIERIEIRGYDRFVFTLLSVCIVLGIIAMLLMLIAWVS